MKQLPSRFSGVPLQSVGWLLVIVAVAAAVTALTFGVGGALSTTAQPTATEMAGNGTLDAPYEIENWEQLAAVRENPDSHFLLTATLNSSTAGYDDVVGESGMERLSTSFTGGVFTKSFDGGGHTIADVVVVPSQYATGLFGGIAENATVSNLSLVNVTVESERQVGGLVGLNLGGTVSNVSVAGEIIGDRNTSGNGDTVGGVVGFSMNDATVTNVTFSGTVVGNRSVGGIIGENGATLVDATVTGEVTGTARVGGAVGLNSQAGTTLSDVQTTVTVVGTDRTGGVVGWNSRPATNLVANGTVTGGVDTGGIAGYNREALTDSFSDVSVSGEQYTGGVVGFNTGSLSDVTAVGNVSGTMFAGGVAGLTSAPLTHATATGAVSGTQLVGGLAGANTGDISVGVATGAVNGSLVVGGLVGAGTAPVSEATATGDVSGDILVGGLAGATAGNITDSSATGAVTGTEGVGGLVAATNASVSTSLAVGDVTGERGGALAGFNLGHITDAYASGTVTGSSPKAVHSTEPLPIEELPPELAFLVAEAGLEGLVESDPGTTERVYWDSTGDGLLNDLTGDGKTTIADVQALFDGLGNSFIQANAERFGFAGLDTERVSIFDVQGLFRQFQQ